MKIRNPFQLKNSYTLVIIPHEAEGKPFSLKIPKFVVKTTIFSLIIAIVVVSGSVIYSSWLSRRMVSYYQTVAKNQEQHRVIEGFSQETIKVQKQISELMEQDNALRKTLGLKSWQSKIKLNERFNGRSNSSFNLQQAKLQLAEKRQSLTELKSWVSKIQKRLAASPSGWPLRGQIMSGFGYRPSPWRGMHNGLDIDSSYGTPVRCTGTGIVSYAGWRQGYGKTVVIEHAYGLSTLYGHCSGFAVRPGQLVKKGQVVSYVGLTGYTTGSHLHYEVRRADQPVNPIAYLNLNLLTASRIWSK